MPISRDGSFDEDLVPDMDLVECMMCLGLEGGWQTWRGFGGSVPTSRSAPPCSLHRNRA